MKICCVAYGPSGEAVRSAHTSVRALRRQVESVSARAAFLDLLPDAEDADPAPVTHLLDDGRFVVTGRLFHHLSRRERRGARRRSKPLAGGCPVYVLAGGLDATEPFGNLYRGVQQARVAKFLASEPLYGADPLPPAFARALKAGRFKNMSDLLGTSEAELTSLPGIGPRTVAALRAWVSRRVAALGGGPLTLSTVRRAINPGAAGLDPLARLAAGLPEAVQELDVRLLDDLLPRLPALLRRHNVRRVRDLRWRREAELLGWPGLGRAGLERFRKTLEGLARTRAVDVESLARELVLVRPLLARIRASLATVPEREARILEARGFSASKQHKTLRELAQELGVSSARVGSLQQAAFRRLDPTRHLARVADHQLASHAGLTLAALEKADAWFRGVKARPLLFARVLDALNCLHEVVLETGAPHVAARSGGRPRIR